MNETQFECIDSVYTDYSEDIIAAGFANYLSLIVNTPVVNKGDLKTLLSVELLANYRVEPAYREDLRQVVNCLTNENEIPEDVISRLEGSNNTSLYNLAALEEVKRQIRDLPENIKSPLIFMAEAAMGMTALAEARGMLYRPTGLPFHLENLGPSLTREEIKSCVDEAIIKAVNEHLQTIIDSSDVLRAAYKAFEYLSRGENFLAGIAMNELICSEAFLEKARSFENEKLLDYIAKCKDINLPSSSFLTLYQILLDNNPDNCHYKIQFIDYCINTDEELLLHAAINILIDFPSEEMNANIFKLLIQCFMKVEEYESALSICWLIIKTDYEFEEDDPIKALYINIINKYGLEKTLSLLSQDNPKFNNDDKLIIYLDLLQELSGDMALIIRFASQIAAINYTYLTGLFKSLNLLFASYDDSIDPKVMISILDSLNTAKRWGVNVDDYMQFFYLHNSFTPDLLVDYGHDLITSKNRIEFRVEGISYLNMAADKYESMCARFILANLMMDGASIEKDILGAAQIYLKIKCQPRIDRKLSQEQLRNARVTCAEALLFEAYRLEKQDKINEAYRHLKLAYALNETEETHALLSKLIQKMPVNLFDSPADLAEHIVLLVKNHYHSDKKNSGQQSTFNKDKFKLAKKLIAKEIRDTAGEKILKEDSVGLVKSVSGKLTKFHLFYEKSKKDNHISINTEVVKNNIELKNCISESICKNN